MKGFRPIDADTPRQRTPMIVVMAIDVPVQQGALRYTTDPYCVWWDEDYGRWARWPHPYPPTHWLPLDIGEKLEAEHARAESFRIGREAADARIEELAPALVDCTQALADMIDMAQSAGCQVCGGDCVSANPPVLACPTLTVLEAKSKLHIARKVLGQ